MTTSRHVNSITGRLSLRKPQQASLKILDRVMEIAQPHKRKQAGEVELASMLELLRSEYPTVEGFERAFPNLCFALATGVGKTRLMGAFISYLFLEHGIRHFFVLAPNLTIYNKLVADFTPNTPKYVFQGISAFATKAPTLVTGENFEQKPRVLDLFERDDVVINIFNISKFNEKAKGADDEGKKRLKVRAFREFLGTSYFDYLAGLDDLVIIMDEAHRYRADTSAKSIEELKPVLGIELTATPQIEAGARSARFKNIIYDYPLATAMQDGFVKEPAVATRADFDPKAMDKEALELLKLEDGVRLHENTRVELEVYAKQTGERRVKPFVLVIAEDTDHAAELVTRMESESFFGGYYKGRVIQVHSGQKGAERDENVERLLAVERSDEPTEIVVHVNMLKEGWDVTNLYTIIPLRTADSRTLVEQSIGRGLRLPYGKRTGVTAVDRLTIVAHDRFQEIVDEAKKGGYAFKTVQIDNDAGGRPKQTVTVPPSYSVALGIAVASSNGGASPSAHPDQETAGAGATSVPLFVKEEEIAAATATIAAITRLVRDPKVAPTPASLQRPEVQLRLLEDVRSRLSGSQLAVHPELGLMTDRQLAHIVCEVTAVFATKTIAIPRVMVLPQGEVRTGVQDFTLDLSGIRFSPVAQSILIQHLNSDFRERIDGRVENNPESRLEDYVVRGLIDFDDVSYDDQAELLYKLAAEVVAHLRTYLKEEEEVRNVLLFHAKPIAAIVHAQMHAHAWEEASSYESIVVQGFSEMQEQAFSASAGESVRPFDRPLDNKVAIRNMLFGGFEKCIYATQKFDSDTERRFTVVLEQDPTVLKWLKPGRRVFQIRLPEGVEYEPDFVVETATEKLICEPKAADQMEEATVLEKAQAAARWCEHATVFEMANGGKPWRYLLIPHDAIADNMTLDGLAQRFTVAAQPGAGR